MACFIVNTELGSLSLAFHHALCQEHALASVERALLGASTEATIVVSLWQAFK